MTYLDELRGIDTVITELKQRVAALEQQVDQLQKSIPRRMATERQKAFINDICATLCIPYPEGFPNRITFQEASAFINAKARFFYDAKRSEKEKPKAEVGLHA